MNIEALHQAIRVLREVEAEARPFNMGSWVCALRFNPRFVGEPDCGTASCAAGWCARDAWFNAQGFTMRRRGLSHGLSPALKLGAVGEFYNWDACEAMFGLTSEDTQFLFLPDTYAGSYRDITPRHVIERIETLLARHAPDEPKAKHETPVRELVPA